MDAVAELFEAAAGKVGAADAAAEEHIAAQDHRLLPEQKCDMAGRVARDFEDVKLQPGERQPVALAHSAVRRWAGHREAKWGAQVQIGIAEHRLVAGADDHRRFGK